MRKAVVFSITAVLLFSWLFLPGLTERLLVSAQDDAPEIKKLRPNLITAGTRTFTIRLEGRRFAEGANVLFDGVPLPLPRIARKGKILLAEVDASLIANPGTHSIQAQNPDGASTQTLTLTVSAQNPELQILLDGNAAQEDSGLIFLPTLLTDSFGKGSTVTVWGRETTVTEVSGGVQIEVSNDFVNDPAEIPITLISKDGSISNTELFFVVPAPAEITGIDPEVLQVGTDDVPLIVSGIFKPGATIVVNDMVLATTVGKNERLEATIPGNLRTAPTQLVIRVEQEGIQSRDTILPVTPTSDPFIFNVAPIRIRQGENKPSLEVIGANFGKDVTAFIDGQETFIRSASKTTLTVALEKDIAVGAHTVQVKDPDGNLYITDQQNHAIRTADLNTGQVCTVAGTGEEGYNDSGNSAGKPPTFSFPNGIALDSSGAIYVTENGNSVVRRIQRSGGTVTLDTVVGMFNEVTDKHKQ